MSEIWTIYVRIFTVLKREISVKLYCKTTHSFRPNIQYSLIRPKELLTCITNCYEYDQVRQVTQLCINVEYFLFQTPGFGALGCQIKQM